MEKFTMVMLGAIFITLISSSFQSLAAQNENDIMNSQYSIHLQVIVRDANGQLVSVIESTNTAIFPTYLPDGKLVEGFIDYMFDQELQNDYQVTTIDGTKYEKIEWTTHIQETDPGLTVVSAGNFNLCAQIDGYGEGETCIPSFWAKTDQIYLDVSFTKIDKWTILRELN
jgi:hypothetical protein